MKQITTAQLVELLEAKKGCEFATVYTESDAKLLKTNNPFKSVSKRQKMTVNIGWGYENAVNNQRKREDMEADFIAQPRKWGVRKNLKIVEHKGASYITMKCEKHFATTYHAGIVELTKAQVEPFFPKSYKATTQGVEKDVKPMDFKATSIKRITLRGESYEIV